jgi:hypothetical protein
VVGTAAGAQPRKPRGGEDEGHWHPTFAVQATGAQPRACARGHCPVPTGARRPERWSPDPRGRLEPWTQTAEHAGIGEGELESGDEDDGQAASCGQTPMTEQGRAGRGLDLDGGVTLGIGPD